MFAVFAVFAFMGLGSWVGLVEMMLKRCHAERRGPGAVERVFVRLGGGVLWVNKRT
jgi:hypothetical protein